MIYPTVHSNGTGHAGLRRQYDDAIEAVRKAMTALQETHPHGRDYYTQDATAFPRAQEEYRDRQWRLSSVYDELVHLRAVLEGIEEKR